MPKIPQNTVDEIKKLFAAGDSKTTIARKLKLTRNTVRHYTELERAPNLGPESEIGAGFSDNTIDIVTGVELPPSIERDSSPFVIDNTPGNWLVLSDVHIPFHDRKTLELAAETGVKRGVVGILLNGDILDCIGLSSKFHKRPDDHTFKLERQYGVQFLDWLRGEFPKARIVYKVGNHEERLQNYIAQKAPELFDIEELTLEHLLEMPGKGIEIVDDRRLIRLGRLPVLHGHEYQSGISAPVNPARGAFLRSVHTILVGHSHQTSEHHERDITGKPIATWSTGCCCGLKPRYSPYNKWNNGFAVVEVGNAGAFSVNNLRVIEGVVR